MATDIEIARAIEAVTADLNDRQLNAFDAGRTQEIADPALGGDRWLTIDDGGGLQPPKP